MGERLDILRAMDGYDRLGPIGVFERLTSGRRDASGAWTEGCGVSRGQAAVLAGVLSHDILDRLEMMSRLEDKVIDADGNTLWDVILRMTPNDDETWDNGGRPRNIACALDDLISVAKGAAG